MHNNPEFGARRIRNNSDFLLMRNSKVNGRISFLLSGVWCHMPSTSTTIVFPKVRLAGHFQPYIWRFAQTYAIFHFLQISEIWDMSWMHLIYVWLRMVMSVIRTCHNKLHCTFYQVGKASPHFTFKFSFVSRVEVFDNQGSSSYNFNSSL